MITVYFYRNCTVFLDLHSLITIVIVWLHFGMLAVCPWICTCYSPWLQDNGQPITANPEMLIGQLRHLHVLEVILNLIDSSRGQRSA